MANKQPSQTMTRRFSLLTGLLVIILVGLACNLPSVSERGVETPEGFVETSIAQTVAASGPQADGETPLPAAPTDTMGPSSTPEPTATETLTPTATLTATPEVPLVYVSENTNCRFGPGAVYDLLALLMSGEESEVVAKDPTENYWYIRNPDQPDSFCWLWGKYATPEGDTESLPVFTPPPTPTLGFDYKVSYVKMLGPCSGAYGLMYRIDNIGAFTLESWRTTATDHTGGTTPEERKLDFFGEYSGCVPVNKQVNLTPGESYYVWSVFDGNPKGHDITTKIKICQKDGLGGDCLTKNFRHTP